ncbi:MAG: hypothetical protein IJE40_04490 [Clostridia bacterium]|nr:hypothetical protein [Clostridia bacterium]
MEIVMQIMILGLAILGLTVMIKEIGNIYGSSQKLKGKTYILCIPQTPNIEEFCAEILNKYRRIGIGDDILICGENLSEEDKKIGRLIETADKGIYFIEPDDLPKLVK